MSGIELSTAMADRLVSKDPANRVQVMVAERDRRIAELGRLFDDARRSGKRQAAPFRRRDEPADEPARPGRKSGGEHGRHGHRMAPFDPTRTLVAPLPGLLS